ncbi:MAG: hypothetical protein JO313_12905 [Verrucomicrobia bacterium]|nr:hypothetical protein [Verrucomicrobiota bacterium]
MSGQHLATRFRKPSKNPASALSQRRRMVIIAAPPVRMLDVFDPAEVFVDANRLRGSKPTYEVEVVSAGHDKMVASHLGMPLLTHRTYRELSPAARYFADSGRR